MYLTVPTHLLVLGAAAAVHASSCQTSQPTVKITNGTVVGLTNTTSHIDKFLGIPYAQPPVGDLRLRQALPLNTSFGTLAANNFGPACYGNGNPNPSEDCLTLNIWRPSAAAKQRDNGLAEGSSESLPVFVWLYGGGLMSGYTADPHTEGTSMVRISTEIGKPVILVTLNYRLGSLGFLNGRQMAELGLLNIGMLDQRLAFHWIQENIAAFGGDPKKVTLFGESAGAVSIYSHMVAYGGRDDGLFRGAILQSGGAFPLSYPNTTAYQKTFDGLITKTECSSLADALAEAQLECIRRLPIDVYRASVGSSTGQSIDGGFTPTSIQFAFPAGKYVKVATMVGANTDEGTTSAPTNINTEDQLKGPLSAGYFRPETLPNKTVDTLLSLYPTDPRLGCPYNTGTTKLSPGALDKQACSIFGDLVQIAPARMIARALSAHNGKDAPVYRYRFNQLPYNTTAVSKGVGTGIEISYVFSDLVPNYPWDQALAYEMTSAWVSFAYNLNPNPGGNSALPFWPTYLDNASSMVFNGYGSVIEPDTYRAAGIDYIIDNVLPYGAH